MSASESMWVRVCGAKLGPIHVRDFPKLMNLHRLTADVRSGEAHCYIADPRHLAEVVDLVASTARAEGETAGYARGRREAFSEGAELLARLCCCHPDDTNDPEARECMACQCAAALRAKAGEEAPHE